MPNSRAICMTRSKSARTRSIWLVKNDERAAVHAARRRCRPCRRAPRRRRRNASLAASAVVEPPQRRRRRSSTMRQARGVGLVALVAQRLRRLDGRAEASRAPPRTFAAASRSARLRHEQPGASPAACASAAPRVDERLRLLGHHARLAASHGTSRGRSPRRAASRPAAGLTPACRARSSAAREILERVLVAAQAEPHQRRAPAPPRSARLIVRRREGSPARFCTAARRRGSACRAARAAGQVQIQPPRLVLEPAARGVKGHLRQARPVGQPILPPVSTRRRRGGSPRAAAPRPTGRPCRAAASAGSRPARRGGAPGCRSRSGGARRCPRPAASPPRRRRARAPAARPRSLRC